MSGFPDEDGVGYRKPPRASRFPKGQSGNPRGRPRGRRNSLPYDSVLGQMVTIHEEGTERSVTAAEAFLLHMAKRGLEGDGAAARAAMATIEKARALRGPASLDIADKIILQLVAPGSVNPAMRPLGMATKLDAYRPTARIALAPWLVEAALTRLGTRQLTRTEQEVVMRATRTPKKVRWPDWWECMA